MTNNNSILYNANSLAALRKMIGVSYLGNVKQSAKMKASYRNGTMTYCLYLAPSNLSGYNVCPNSAHCRANCLNFSGHSKIEILANKNNINRSRVKKTKFFYEQRELFMELLILEIESRKRAAERLGMDFSVRLNGTSDLSPELFVYEGKNILEWFPDVQFYDYTKVPTRMKLIDKYPNYDLTFSFDGYNWLVCERFLRLGGRVAVVIDSDVMPKKYNGWNVVSGNEYDMRYEDPQGCIIGLHYHPVASDYVKGKYVHPNTPFVVLPDNPLCEW